MRRHRYAVLSATAVVAGCIIAGVLLTLPPGAPRTSTITGAVLVQNSDARKQTPIADVAISATAGTSTGATQSDSSGLFLIRMTPAVRRRENISLSFRHAGYEPLQLTEPAMGQIVLAYMTPLPAPEQPHAAEPQSTLRDIRVRYSMNTEISADSGSIAPTFEVVNTNGVPCDDHSPCSPDGRWKATQRTVSFDAGPGRAYHNIRVSCIAGPCPFTKIQSEQRSNNGQVFSVSVLNWSDTATFLVEAEVMQRKQESIVRELFPVEFGQALSFTLPPTAEGPAIEASVNDQEIVFPLGPDLILPWASCTVKVQQDSSKLYRCDLNDNFRFK